MWTRRRAAQAAIGAAATLCGLSSAAARTAPYRGPAVIIVRFGGGVRRRETIEPATSFAPLMMGRLAPRGVLIPNMMIDALDGVDTSHAEGTLNILTGRYRGYRAAPGGRLAPRLEPTVPTVFETFRASFAVAPEKALLINGEDRPQEEFFAYGVHKSGGVAFRSEVLSLRRFKRWSLRRQLAATADGRSSPGGDADAMRLAAALAALDAEDPRGAAAEPNPAIHAFWSQWRATYGDSGLKNPRGDGALTELAILALDALQPQLMMINYQDPDYVHWGNVSHYTRAIARIDRDLDRLAAAVERHEAYRGRTVFVVTPDCGRDANPLMEVPFQHHFNSRSAHEIWALIFGAGVVRGRVLDAVVDQSSVAATVAALMGVAMPNAEGRVLSEIFT